MLGPVLVLLLLPVLLALLLDLAPQLVSPSSTVERERLRLTPNYSIRRPLSADRSHRSSANRSRTPPRGLYPLLSAVLSLRLSKSRSANLSPSRTARLLSRASPSRSALPPLSPSVSLSA